jgi:phage terminase large subunit-like protein
MDNIPMDWKPTYWTEPLSEDFITDGDKIINIAHALWRLPEKHDELLVLTDWQKWLIRHVLERFPDDYYDPSKAGRLRYKQVVISMPRKNGKSLLGALFALYGLLLHEGAPEVISVAASADQAKIVYRRLKHQVDSSDLLGHFFSKTTEHRGLFTKDGTGMYKVIGSNVATAQGLHPSMVIFDELHVAKEDVWTAMALGSATRDDGITIGITTAGDDTSELLKHLYERGMNAINGQEDLERFGFFCWEAPKGCALDDEDAVRSANPQLASGILNWESVKNELATMPEPDARRYRLNQFVSSMNAWIPVGAWGSLPDGRPTNPEVFAIDRTSGWEYVSIVTAQLQEDGRVATELVASFTNTNIDEIIKACMTLGKYGKPFIMDSNVLDDLGASLKQKGLRVQFTSNKDLISASNNAYSRIMKKELIHPRDELVSMQMQRAVRKNSGESWRIARKDSGTDIDAAVGTVLAVWFVDTQQKPQQMVH